MNPKHPTQLVNTKDCDFYVPPARAHRGHQRPERYPEARRRRIYVEGPNVVARPQRRPRHMFGRPTSARTLRRVPLPGGSLQWARSSQTSGETLRTRTSGRRRTNTLLESPVNQGQITDTRRSVPDEKGRHVTMDKGRTVTEAPPVAALD